MLALVSFASSAVALFRCGIRDRHWEQISEKCGVEVGPTMEGGLTLQRMLDVGLLKYSGPAHNIPASKGPLRGVTGEGPPPSPPPQICFWRKFHPTTPHVFFLKRLPTPISFLRSLLHPHVLSVCFCLCVCVCVAVDVFGGIIPDIFGNLQRDRFTNCFPKDVPL